MSGQAMDGCKLRMYARCEYESCHVLYSECLGQLGKAEIDKRLNK